MPNGHTDPRAEIYRQIIVTLPEVGTLDKARQDLYDALHGVPHHRRDSIDEIRAELIQLAPDEDVDAVCAQLLVARVAVAAQRNRVLHASAVVDDPLYAHQWALGRMGAEPAWLRARSTVASGAPGVVVAVVDSGIQTAHPDLVAHLWNDGAGNHGVNLIDENYVVYDGDGHGTRLAGTIGACSNNTLGIAAAEWPLRLMAVKFTDIRNPPSAWTGADAIVWAVLHGAQIINVAWGVGVPFPVLRDAITFAGTWGTGVLVVAAAGNDGLDNDRLPTYPASYPDCPNLISVMASNRRDDKPWFSNYGRNSVHLAAPGVRILTTDTYLGTPQWREYTGTSAACAHVTYAAALIKTMNPSWRPAEIRRHLVASVARSRWLKCIARGRLSLERAVLGPFIITSPVAGDVWTRSTNETITWRNSYTTGRPTTTVTIEILKGDGSSTVLAAGRPNNGACTVVAPAEAIVTARIRIRSDQAPCFYTDSGVFSVQ